MDAAHPARMIFAGAVRSGARPSWRGAPVVSVGG